jgi:hypothetical protein
MKYILIVITLLLSTGFVTESEYNKGFKDGHCEGWKDIKGDWVICPYPPYPAYPVYPRVSTSYQDGFVVGFKRGRKDAK